MVRRRSSVIAPDIWGNEIREIKLCVCFRVQEDGIRQATFRMAYVFLAPLWDFELFLWEWGSQRSLKC